VFADVNNDGKVDLLVADDSTPNYLYLNKGDGTFEDVSYASGYALNENGRETAAMGIAIGDYRNNGLLDIYNTTFSDDYNPLYRNDGDANFTDVSYEMGIAEVTVPFLGWGAGLWTTTTMGGRICLWRTGMCIRRRTTMRGARAMPSGRCCFTTSGGGEEVPRGSGGGGDGAGGGDVPGRGAAFGDLFNDGKIDVVMNCMDSSPKLLRNVVNNGNHWVELKLVGGAKSPRDAVGSTVYVTAGGIKAARGCVERREFESSSDPRVHFGLGRATAVDAVEVHWPDGQVEGVKLPGVDRIVTVEEGKGVVAISCRSARAHDAQGDDCTAYRPAVAHAPISKCGLRSFRHTHNS
jgi:hypothetical protein